MTGPADSPSAAPFCFVPTERRPLDRALFGGALLLAILGHAVVLSLVPLPAAPIPDVRPPSIHDPIELNPVALPPPPAAAPLRTASSTFPRRVPLPATEPRAPEPVLEPPTNIVSEPLPDGLLPALAPGAVAPPRPSGPVEETMEGLQRPRPLPGRVDPGYPELGRRIGVGGIVVLRAVITEAGEVASIEVLRAPVPDVGFSEAAVTAVRGWRYEPGRLHGQPVAVTMTVVVEFSVD